MTFPSIRIEGSILSGELLAKLDHADTRGQRPADFGCDSQSKLKDEIVRAWTAGQAFYKAFQHKLEGVKEGNAATSETRNQWIIPLLGLLGYAELEFQAQADLVGDKPFRISHRLRSHGAFAVHIVGARESLDRKPEAGAGPRVSPHAHVQEYLNLTEHLYAVVTNGRLLRLLRDSTRLVRLSYVEFDLDRMFGEDLFADFAVFYRLLHVTRLPKAASQSPESLVEHYHQDSLVSGERIRDGLSGAVKDCILKFADGFLNHPQSEPLRELVRTNEPIKWGHLLAWCTRDQEARFQNIHDWRSPRSDSDWPSFRFPKSDPLFVMRVVLGLFLRDELEGEEALSKLQQTLEKQESALEVAKKEPAYWREHYDGQLRKQLQGILPEDAAQIANALVATDDILPDLKRFTAKAKYQLGEQLQKLEDTETSIQNEINGINERIAADKSELQQLAGLFKLETTAEGEAAAGLKRDEEFRQLASANKDKICPYGDILIGDCSHVQERQKLLDRYAIKDTHALEQMEAKRAAARERAAAQQRTLNQNIRASELKRKNLTERQNKLVVEVSQKRTLQSAMDTDLESLTAWKARHESPDKYGKLHEQVAAIEGFKKQINDKKEELNRLLAEHDANRDLLNTIFSKAARQVLPSANYDGKVKLEDRELHFQITHGGTMTGEAMETLAVLLADISCLVYNSFSSRSYLPGFLLHDSPREADLGLRLYRGFFRFAAQLQSDFQSRGGVPFQYVITTTTSPPKDLTNDSFVALQLDASKETELLFRRDLSRPPEKEQLDLISEK